MMNFRSFFQFQGRGGLKNLKVVASYVSALLLVAADLLFTYSKW